jgi:hypothetical protein
LKIDIFENLNSFPGMKIPIITVIPTHSPLRFIPLLSGSQRGNIAVLTLQSEGVSDLSVQHWMVRDYIVFQ